MKQTVTLQKLLSEETIEKLDHAMLKGNMEELKKELKKLFTYKKIFNLHDDHLAELADFIIMLFHTKTAERQKMAHDTETYVRMRIARYQQKKENLMREIQWAKATGNLSDMDILDLNYRFWIYESGYEYSRVCMYRMICRIAQDTQTDEVKPV